MFQVILVSWVETPEPRSRARKSLTRLDDPHPGSNSNSPVFGLGSFPSFPKGAVERGMDRFRMRVVLAMDVAALIPAFPL
jgi:hypothetical protein